MTATEASTAEPIDTAHVDERVDVIIIGAGPVGMFCALELLEYGLTVAILETRTEPDNRLRARVLQSQTLSILERRGLLHDISPSERRTVVHFAGFERIDISQIRADHPYSLFARQQALELLMEKRLASVGSPPRRGHTVIHVATAADGAVVTVEAKDRPGADYHLAGRVLLACEGGRSRTRRQLGIGFDGKPPTLVGFQAMATVRGSADLSDGWHRTDQGMYVIGPGRRMALVDYGSDASRVDDTTDLAAEYAASLRRVVGADVTATSVESLTRFSDNSRLASHYRKGWVFLVGDAAHVHPPFAAQGLNLGIQDASNLTWKLGGFLTGALPESVLDTYEQERRPVAERVIDLALSQSALMRPDDQTTALRVLFANLLDSPVVNRELAEQIAGIRTRYRAHECPAVGAYARDQALVAADGTLTSLVELQRSHPTRHVVIDGVACEATGTTLDSQVADGIRVVAADSSAPPGEGRTHLVRPDGYVATCLAPEDRTHP